MLAIGDLSDVSRAARLIADHDPDLRLARRIGETGVDAAVAEAELRPPPAVLGDFRTRLLLETGLIVTYARPFTPGYGIGFPLPDDDVSEDKREFHQRLLTLRNQVYAHVDASGPEGFQRQVLSRRVNADGAVGDETRGPRLLGEDELRAMADHADEIVERLKVALAEARASQGQ